MRPSGRAPDELRAIKLTRNYTKHAEGSVLVEFGDTKVICTASVNEGVPRFLKGSGQGWVTAEYGMLPRSTGSRMGREAAQGKQGGRTMEIQRLIGRSLRAVADLTVRRVAMVAQRVDHRVLEVRAAPPGDEAVRPAVPALLLQERRHRLGQPLLHVDHRAVLVEHQHLHFALQDFGG